MTNAPYKFLKLTFDLIAIIMFLMDTVQSVTFKAVRFDMDVLFESSFWKRFKEHAKKYPSVQKKNQSLDNIMIRKKKPRMFAF